MEERDSLVTKLHTILDPFMLRRMKSDVLELSLPPKREFQITIELTEKQKELYKAAKEGKLREAIAGGDTVKGKSKIIT